MQDHAFPLPADLPRPIDDGAAAHLLGAALPDIELPATTGTTIRLSAIDRSVIFAYPRTGTPDRPPGPDWDAIPGARGCTPQSCGFRDLKAEFDALHVGVLGLSTQTTAFQMEFAKRTHFPFPILSDSALVLVKRMRLPTFDFDVATFGGGGPTTLIRRMAWYVEDGRIKKLWYPVFPPDTNAQIVLDWLSQRANVS